MCLVFYVALFSSSVCVVFPSLHVVCWSFFDGWRILIEINTDVFLYHVTKVLLFVISIFCATSCLITPTAILFISLSGNVCEHFQTFIIYTIYCLGAFIEQFVAIFSNDKFSFQRKYHVLLMKAHFSSVKACFTILDISYMV